MEKRRLHELEQLLATATDLLADSQPRLQALDAYQERRETVFARLWDGEVLSTGERVVVEVLIEEILQKSSRIAAKAWSLRMARLDTQGVEAK